jgi:hypothetical protein
LTPLALTGSVPTATDGNFAGLSHTLCLKTSYYTADISIWLDVISKAAPEEWSGDFLTQDAAEVLAAIGAFIVVFQKPVDENSLQSVIRILEEVGKVIKQGCGDHWDGVLFAVGMKSETVPALVIDDESWEEKCRPWGFEWVDGEAVGKNEYGGMSNIDLLAAPIRTGT